MSVRQVAVPEGVAELAGLDRVDYREAFECRTGVRRSPEAWARRIIAGAPLADRVTMVGTWTALGIRLAGPWRADQVLGWRILRNDEEAIVLGAHAAIGLTARLVLEAGDGRVLQAMLVRYDRGLGERVWRSLAPKHRHFVAGLILRATT